MGLKSRGAWILAGVKKLRRGTWETRTGWRAWILDFFLEWLMQITSARWWRLSSNGSSIDIMTSRRVRMTWREHWLQELLSLHHWQKQWQGAGVVTKPPHQPPHQQNARKEVSTCHCHHPQIPRRCFHHHRQVMVRDWQRGRSNRLPHKRGKQPKKLSLSCCNHPQVPHHFPKVIWRHKR